ncbi:undecaprenyl-phosphate glucose phosphotransferase [Massilia sp. DWR3-1-1]|uniref:undecaprenyl-phosphate glucose phosphotransferase n=1 Tax=Massilia sp. DWR3-1-1 TaxID=2804559 RepID=UPI003CED35FC
MNNHVGSTVVTDQDASVAAPVGHAQVPAFPRRGVGDLAGYGAAHWLNVLKIADLLALLLAGFGGYFLRFGFGSTMAPASHLFVYLGTVVTIVSLHIAQGYRARALTSLYTMISTLFVGGTCALCLISVCGYLSGSLHEYSRLWFGLTICASAALLVINRIVVTQVVRRAIAADKMFETIVVVGANEHAVKMIRAIRVAHHANVKVLGVFDDRLDRPIPESLRVQMLGSTTALLDYIRSNYVDRVIVALPWVASERIDGLLNKLRTVPVRIDLVPNDVVWRFAGMNMERVGTVPVLTIANGRVAEQSGIIKRAEDLVISSVLLLLIAPLLLLIALAIKLDSKGPVIFKQRRHGFNNDVFEVYKFRSMTVADSASSEVKQATRNDFRVTKVGKFLRRSSLDELPQLFNVIRGSMSIVGPRPHAVQHNIEFSSIISEYFARHNVKPGITGWAQVNGLRGETNTVDKMHRRVQFDLHYIENWSLALDIKIILRTAIAVWFDANAY